jgi:hypothetical protein
MIKQAGDMGQHSLGGARENAEGLRHCTATRNAVKLYN